MERSLLEAIQTFTVDYHAWNAYRYLGDFFRAAGHVVALAWMCSRRSTVGVSRTTQVMDLIVYCSRYIDLLTRLQHGYLVFFKIFFIGSSSLALLLFRVFRQTYENEKDTCPMYIFIVPSLIVSLSLSDAINFNEVMWTFSQILQGFAMVPQYIFCYRDDCNGRCGVVAYITCMGLYRVFYACHWMNRARYDPHYSDPASWISGAINIVFFLDYIVYRFFGFGSFLRRFTLGVDDGVNEVSMMLKDRLDVALLPLNSDQVRSSDVELGSGQYAPVEPTPFGAPMAEEQLEDIPIGDETSEVLPELEGGHEDRRPMTPVADPAV